MQDNAEHLNSLLGPFEKEGIERSVRISPGDIRWDRFLIGIEKRNLEPDNLESIAGSLNMPEAFRADLRDGLADANQVLFGFEAGPSSDVFKIYLEYWDRIVHRVRSNPSDRSPALLHLGFKWGAQGASRQVVTEYRCFPMLSQREVCERAATIYAADRQEARNLALRILERAYANTGDPAFIYMEVSEKNQNRKSFDINLYKSGLAMGDIAALFRAALNHYGVGGDEAVTRFEGVASRPFGHLAGGIDREGKDFLTFYYEDEL